MDTGEDSGHLASLQAHAEYFDRMVNRIPAKHYFPANDENDVQWNKYMKNKKGAAPKQATKEASRKARKAKFDPTTAKTVVDVQLAGGPARKRTRSGSDSGEGSECPRNSPPKKKVKEKERATDMEGVVLSRKQKRAVEKEAEKERAKERKREKKREKRKAEKGALTEKQRPFESTTATDGGGSQLEDDAVQFSAFKFAEKNTHAPKRGESKKKLLKKAEKAEEKVRKVEAEHGKAAGAVASLDQSWQAILQRAQGLKVKDNAELLRKSIKREKKQKEKSAKAWKERIGKVKKAQKEKQEKRKKNLQARVDRKKDKKSGKKGKSTKAAPGGKMKAGRAGFEGRKKSFLN